MNQLLYAFVLAALITFGGGLIAWAVYAIWARWNGWKGWDS